MTIQQIYTQFLIPHNLQEHMLRVGAFTQIIMQNWTGQELDQKSVVIAALLHDLAKPITFEIEKQADYGMKSEDIARLAKLQNMLKQKYGTAEHQVLLSIARDLNCSATTVNILQNVEWDYIPTLLQKNKIQPLLVIYADMRTAWNGVVPLVERLDSLQKRTKVDETIDFQKYGLNLEQYLQAFCQIDLQQIKARQVEKRCQQLLLRSLGN